MSKTIFFSWQADTPNKVGRTFLRQVLEEVCASIISDTSIDEAMREVEVDSDTQGVAGQPPVAETIFNKIDIASVFVADMTFIGKRLGGRPTPNPNVLIEYGWALKSLSNERVICVMNTAYGEPTSENLPFDLAHLRWPIPYSLNEDDTLEIKTKENQRLKRVLTDAIRLCLKTVPSPMSVPMPSFPYAQANDGPARFRAPGDAIGFCDDNVDEDHRPVLLNRGPAMWLRLIPKVAPKKLFSTKELKTIAQQKPAAIIPLLDMASGYSFVRASDGQGMYKVELQDTHNIRINAGSVTFTFKTGEIWSIDTLLLGYEKTKLFMTDIENRFSSGLERYSQYLKMLGIDPPFQWKAGLVGIMGRELSYAPPPGAIRIHSKGPVCVTDTIEADGEFSPGESSQTVLLPFFKKIFDECGIDRPDYLKS